MINRTYIIWPLFILLLITLTISLLTIGSDISLGDLIDYLMGKELSTLQYSILHYLRVPKVILILLVGGLLALAGFLMQQVVNNPLADPYLLGTASGAALGVNLSIVGFSPVLVGYLYDKPLYGFIMGFLTTLLVIGISSQKKVVNTLILVISGVSITSLLTAVTSLLIYYSDNTSKLRSMLFWAMGSFEKSNWEQIPVVLIIFIASLVILSFMQKHIVVLMLGGEKASMLGVNVKRIQYLLLAICCLQVSISVAICGPIGFVGLIVPHFSRSLLGGTHQYVVLFTALLGSLFLMISELIAQIIVPSIGLPVGVVSSFVGLPFFLYLLLNKKYRFGQ